MKVHTRRSGGAGRSLGLLAAVACCGLALSPPARAQHSTSRPSGGSFGPGDQEPNGPGRQPSLTANGARLAFASRADNLLGPGIDQNGAEDVFLANHLRPRPILVSVSEEGLQGDGDSYGPSLSPLGRYVAFVSEAGNLVADDENRVADVFLRDVLGHHTWRVSVSSSGTEANGPSDQPAVSADGRFVAFTSFATNLVAGDTNRARDVFLHDRETGRTQRISASALAGEGNAPSHRPALSADGGLVVYQSAASNLVPGDRNDSSDVFLFDRSTGQTARLSVDRAGREVHGESGEPAISAGGRMVTFTSRAAGLVDGDLNRWADVFLRDLMTGTLVRVSVADDGSEANGPSGASAVAERGRVVFQSAATNLVEDDDNGLADIFMRDVFGGFTVRNSIDSSGVQANGPSFEPAISAEGCDIAFTSDATDLVHGDTNGVRDVFCHRHGCCCATLDMVPEFADLGDDVSVVNGGGEPAGLVLLFAVAVDEVPTSTFLGPGFYGSDGLWALDVTVPLDPSLQNLAVALQSFTLDRDGRSAATNLRFLFIR